MVVLVIAVRAMNGSGILIVPENYTCALHGRINLLLFYTERTAISFFFIFYFS